MRRLFFFVLFGGAALAATFLLGRLSVKTAAPERLQETLPARSDADAGLLLEALRAAQACNDELRAAVAALEARLAAPTRQEEETRPGFEAPPAPFALPPPPAFYLTAGSRLRLTSAEDGVLTLERVGAVALELVWKGRRMTLKPGQTLAFDPEGCALTLASLQDGIARLQSLCPHGAAPPVLE